MPQSVTAVQAPSAVGRIDGHTNYASRDYVVASGVTINAGDFVYFSSGTVTNATINGARIVGMAEGTATGNSTGTVSVKVCVDPNMLFLVKSTTSLTITNGTNSNIGQYFDLTGATGAQTASNTGTTVGALVLVDAPGSTTFPNLGISVPTGTTLGLFKVVNHYLLPYVAS